MDKWIRIVSENGQIWEDGIKKHNSQYRDIVPDSAKGYVVLSDGAHFISDCAMKIERLEQMKQSANGASRVRLAGTINCLFEQAVSK